MSFKKTIKMILKNNWFIQIVGGLLVFIILLIASKLAKMHLEIELIIFCIFYIIYISANIGLYVKYKLTNYKVNHSLLTFILITCTICYNFIKPFYFVIKKIDDTENTYEIVILNHDYHLIVIMVLSLLLTNLVYSNYYLWKENKSLLN